MAELVLKREVYQIIGAAMEVYWRLGRGFLEPIYQEAFEIELTRRAIPFEAKRGLRLTTKVTRCGKNTCRTCFAWSDYCGVESAGTVGSSRGRPIDQLSESHGMPCRAAYKLRKPSQAGMETLCFMTKTGGIG